MIILCSSLRHKTMQESAPMLDMKIFGARNCSVACHSAILSLSLPSLRSILSEESCLIFPEFSLQELKTFVKFLYGGNRYLMVLNTQPFLELKVVPQIVPFIYDLIYGLIVLFSTSIEGSRETLSKISRVLTALGQANTSLVSPVQVLILHFIAGRDKSVQSGTSSECPGSRTDGD